MNAFADLLHFSRPEFLWLVLPCALLMVFRLLRTDLEREVAERAGGHPDSPWRRVIATRLLLRLQRHTEVVGATAHTGFGRPHWLGREAVIAVLILALAGPQVPRPGGAAPRGALRPDVARVLVVDLSPDFDALPESSRQRVRTNLRHFVGALPPGETALVVVAGSAWLVVPPTEDVATLEAFLSELASAAVPVPGFRPEAGLALARQTLAATGARRQEIYWLHVSGQGAPKAEPSGRDGVELRILHAGAALDDWLNSARNAARPEHWIVSRLNLGSVASAGWIDLGPALILFALPLVAIDVLRRRKGLAVVLFVALGMSGAGETVHAADAAFDQGVTNYRAGRYAEAAAAFARAAESPAAHYNRGNALARAGRLRAALAAYDESLRLRPENSDAIYNRALVARLLQTPRNAPSGLSGSPPARSPIRGEVERATEQWLRRPPDDVAGLLPRKLALDEARRRNGNPR